MRCIVVLLLGLFMVSSVAEAQDQSVPLIAVSKGDFYAISPADGSIKQLTHHPSLAGDGSPYSQRDLAISPDGQYLAYLQTPRFFAIAMKNNLTGNLGSIPADVVLLNLSTGTEKVIATQQPNVKYSDNARLWYRGNLTWSPDGSQVAYYQTRGTYGETNYQSQLMIYNPSDDQTVKLADGKQPLDEIAWLMEGVSAGTSVWDIAGGPIVHNFMNDGMVFEHFTPYQYGEYAIVDSADVIPHDGKVYLMDMLTGEYSVVDGIQSSVSKADPDHSLVFIKDDNDTRPSYVINPKNGAIFTPPKQAPYAVDFTFSPDGQQFAYILLNTSVNISDLNGHDLTVNLNADTIIWGNKQYTIASKTGDQSAPVNATEDFYNEKRCGTVPPVGLDAGGQGKVIVGGGANRVRHAPSAEAEPIGQIPEGATFTMAEGQQGVCSNGMIWVHVRYKNLDGWTAEGADGKVFLEPVQ